MPAIVSTSAWSSPATSTVSPHLAPSVMIISDELESSPLIVTVLPRPSLGWAMRAAGRACRPTDEPTVTDLLGMGSARGRSDTSCGHVKRTVGWRVGSGELPYVDALR